MRLLRPPARLVGTSPAWRGALWRWRHAFLAVALLSAVLLVAEALAPPPGHVAVALARGVPAGRDLLPADLALRADDGGAPTSSFRAVEDVIGERLVVGLPAGTVVTPQLLLGPGLADGAPPGHTVLPVAIADPGSAALAHIGTMITLIGGSEFEGARILAPEVLVLSVLDEADTGGFISTGGGETTLIVAIPRSLANLVVDANAQGPLRVAVHSPIP